MSQHHHYLCTEIDDCDAGPTHIIAEHAPAVLKMTGVGTAGASTCWSPSVTTHDP
jgi:hypothetical protein